MSSSWSPTADGSGRAADSRRRRAPRGTRRRPRTQRTPRFGSGSSWRTGRSPRSPGGRAAGSCPTRCSCRATAPRRVAEPAGRLLAGTPSRASRPSQVLHGVTALRPDHGPLLVVVGVFDGLHRGHACLWRERRRAAARLGAVPAVLTFDHHPDEIMAGAAPPLLCDPGERLVRLARAGVGVTIVQHFDEALRRTPYDVFVASIASRTGLAGFLMTPDAAFGHERRGTPQALAELGDEAGFRVVIVPPFDLDGRPVRSTEVRAAIAAGDLRHARALLGRRVAVTGEVARGYR